MNLKNPVRGDLTSPDIFAARGADRIFSSDLATALVTLEGRPWGERNGQCPISANAIAVMLAPLDQEFCFVRYRANTSLNCSAW